MATKQIKKPGSTAIVASLPSKTIKPRLSKTELINVMVEIEKGRRKAAFDEAQAKRAALLKEIVPLLVADLASTLMLDGREIVSDAVVPGNGELVRYEVGQWLNKPRFADKDPLFELGIRISVDSPALLALKKRYATIESPGQMSEYEEGELKKALKRKYMADRAEAINAILADSGMREKLEDALDEVLDTTKNQ